LGSEQTNSVSLRFYLLGHLLQNTSFRLGL